MNKKLCPIEVREHLFKLLHAFNLFLNMTELWDLELDSKNGSSYKPFTSPSRRTAESSN